MVMVLAGNGSITGVTSMPTNVQFGGTVGVTGAMNTSSTLSAVSGNFSIDSSGRVTTPYQPMVYASKTTGNWANYYNGGAGTTFVFDTAPVNVGSSYNTSTGIFTCPVAGYYRVISSILMGNASGTSGFYLYKNGSGYGQGSYAYVGGNNVQTGFSWNINCAASDSLKIVAWCSQSGGSYNGVYEAYYNFLSIELVG